MELHNLRIQPFKADAVKRLHTYTDTIEEVNLSKNKWQRDNKQKNTI